MSSDKVLYVNPETKDVIATGNVGIGTTQPLAKLHVNGNLYCPGSVVQCQTVVYSAQTTYTAPAAITPTEVSVLNIAITPKRLNSKIVLQWMINCEVGLETVFLVYRDSILIGYNTAQGNVQWSCVAVAPYDNNNASTPSNINITWIDTPNTTSVTTYSVRVRASDTSYANTLFLGSTFTTLGTFNYEATCSTGTAWEVCV